MSSTESNLYRLCCCILADIKIRFENDRGYLQNVNKDTIPVVAMALPEEGKVSVHCSLLLG